MSRQSIYREIDEERARQDRKYGGARHDDQLDPSQWHEAIVRHADEAAGADNDDVYRKQLVRVAALAVAALEVLDRHEARHAKPKTVHVYGMSDDLVEIAGDLGSEELGIGFDHWKWLSFSDGTLATIAFTEDGWAIKIVEVGTAEATVVKADDVAGLERYDDDHPVLRVRGDVRWIATTSSDPRKRKMQTVPDTVPGSDDARDLWDFIMWEHGATWTNDQ